MTRHCLQIYISGHCLACQEAARMAAEMAQAFPNVCVDLIDVQSAGVVLPPAVFATPTYLWNGKRYSLGNPRPEALRAMIAQSIEGEGSP
jgi:hypothetical protein